MSEHHEPSAYARAGVDIEAGDRAVQLMKDWVRRTERSEVIGGIGGFAGLFDASKIARFHHPVLATSTDGVGTKVAIAQALDVHDTIGFDLMGMLVDDLVVTGAEPLWVTDYIACGKVFPEKIASIVKGIAEACVVAGCALLGGEVAEHPGLLEPHEYDVAGATTGVVEHDDMLGPDRVKPGDVAVAMASSGLHSNGYSLVRQVLLTDAGWSLDREVPELGRALGAELLEPTKVYARDCLALIESHQIHAMSHITGGGLANNLVRVVPNGIGVRVDRSTWLPPAIFGLVQQVGGVSQPDVEATLNQGVGMIALLPADQAADAVGFLERRGIRSWICGETVALGDPDAPGAVEMVGTHG
jgi:phosphoribosylformylglycinamidine cyclo-ligase